MIAENFPRDRPHDELGQLRSRLHTLEDVVFDHLTDTHGESSTTLRSRLFPTHRGSVDAMDMDHSLSQERFRSPSIDGPIKRTQSPTPPTWMSTSDSSHRTSTSRMQDPFHAFGSSEGSQTRDSRVGLFYSLPQILRLLISLADAG